LGKEMSEQSESGYVYYDVVNDQIFVAYIFAAYCGYLDSQENWMFQYLGEL
jgi:hypothetical protein